MYEVLSNIYLDLGRFEIPSLPSISSVSQTLQDVDGFRFEVGKTPFSNPWWPTMGAVGYIGMLIFLPPIVSLANKFLPKKIHETSFVWFLEVVHNINLIALSFVMMLGGALAIYLRITQEGGLFNGFLCSQRHVVGNLGLLDGIAGYWMWIYYLSKYYELIDTFILILKGKKVIFLHAWHHCSMLYGTFTWLYMPLLEGSLWCVFVNSLIHVFMYVYYLITVLAPGKKVWWKRYLTQGQIIQFWSGMMICAVFLFTKIHYGMEACGGNIHTNILSVIVNLSFIILFNNFYAKSYTKKPAVKEKKEQ